MINTFVIEGFKSLARVRLELGAVNVFIGANGSGKSNLLEAIGVLGAAASGRVDDEALLRRGVRPGLPALYKSSFQGKKPPNAVKLDAKGSVASFSVSLFNPTSRPEPAWRYMSEKLTEGAKKLVGRSPRSKVILDASAGLSALKAVEINPVSPAGILLSELRNFAIYSPDTGTLRGLRIDPQTRAPIGLSGGNLAEAVEDVFRGLRSGQRVALNTITNLIGWADAFGAGKADQIPISKSIPQPARVLTFRDRFMAEGRNKLSGYDASEGALYVLFMAALIHHPLAPPILAVDNFDQALNPRLARALTTELCDWVRKRKDRQVLLTSHSPSVLDGLPLQDDSIRLFAVERTNLGHTVVNRVMLTPSVLEAAQEGSPLSQQWVMGTFGGVPANL